MKPGGGGATFPEAARDPGPAAWTAGSFWFHLALVTLSYVTVVIAWGERNSWPDELLLAIATLPCTCLAAWHLYQVHGFGTATNSTQGQQEQLIAALILAVGLASGQLLLMSLGLVCLGIGWLRPTQPGIPWTEWLKIPLLFLTALPFWLDFDPGGFESLTLLGDPAANPVYRFPFAITTTQFRVLAYCGLVAMTLVLPGRAFWFASPLLPAFLLGILRLPTVVPGWPGLPPGLRLYLPWILGTAFLWTLARLLPRWNAASRAWAPGHFLRLWFEDRRHPPWLAVTIVFALQTVPFRPMRLGAEEALELVGLALLLAILGWLRHHTVRGPIHSRSVALVASGLALTLAAEFATSDHLRHVALAFVLIGAMSWHCFWPWRILAVAAAIAVFLVGFPDLQVPAPFPPSALPRGRFFIAAGLLALLAWLVRRPLPQAGARGYDEANWVPSRRFALILLGLMMLFQTASAFWPEHDLPGAGLSSNNPETPPGLESDAGTDPGRATGEAAGVHVLVAYPRKNPNLLQSPEQMLRRRGWHILRTRTFAHPHGEATGFELVNGHRRAAALWWYELGDAAFASPLYARRVLWSGWHLANRNLRLVRLESTALATPEDLARFAEAADWFPRDSENRR